MVDIQQLLKKQVSTLFPGAVVGVVDASNQQQIWSVGTLGGESDPTPVKKDTIYDVASITKSIPTSSVALKLAEQGSLNLDEPILTYFPKIQGEFAHKITVRHLLLNTINFPKRLSRLKNLSAQELHDTITHSLVVGPPEEIFAYNNTSSILLTWIINKITGETLEQLSQEIFFDPLKMTSTSFKVSAKQLIKTAPSEHDSWRNRDVRGEIHDESAWILEPEYGAVGSAGLFSTVPDLLKFGEMLLNNGQPNNRAQNHSIFKLKTIRQIQQPIELKSGEKTCLGWEWRPWTWAGDNISDKCVGKTGFTGCSFLIDWEAGKVIVILSNATYPQRPKDRAKLNNFRREIISSLLAEK